MALGRLLGDRRRRRSRRPAPWLWGGTSLLSFPVLLYYLLAFRRRYGRESPAGRLELGAGTVALASTAAMLLAAVAAPPDPYTQALWWGAPAAVLLVPSVHLVYRGGDERLALGGGA